MIVALHLVSAEPARAAQCGRVEIVAEERARAIDGNHGLLVPGPGPTASRRATIASLVRGRVEHSALDGIPSGPRLIRLNGPGGGGTLPKIYLSVPPPGEHQNNRRYPVVIAGTDAFEPGVLSSESTRIPGLVTTIDVTLTALCADGGLTTEPMTDRGQEEHLRKLDDRIRDKNAARAPAMFLCAGLIGLLALFARRAATVAIGLLLLANLILSAAGAAETWPVLAGFAAAALVALPAARAVDAGVALAVAVVAYLLALGLNGPLVALSPLGPTQNARFYGLSNLLATLLLAAALAAVAGAGVAAAAFVATAGSRFGADGGGAIVLAVGLAVLSVLLYPRRRPLVAAAVVVAAAAVLAFDFAAGGETHVTRALGDGIVDDLVRRGELSWERATRTWYEAVYLGVLLATLAALAWRTARRDAALAALAVALGVSLLVNDSPNEVLVPGVACYLALSRWTLAGRTSAE